MMSPLNMLAPVNGSLDVINDNTPYFRCFDENVLAFIESLSNELLKNSEAKTYPELVALGFWL